LDLAPSAWYNNNIQNLLGHDGGSVPPMKLRIYLFDFEEKYLTLCDVL